MSMVSPLNLMIFGCKKVEYVEGLVKLDNWICLEMNPNDASVVCGLRRALEEILVEAVRQPEEILNLDGKFQNALSVIRRIAEFSAGDYQISRDLGITPDRESNFGRSSFGGPSGFGGGKFARNDSGGFSTSNNFNSGGGYSSRGRGSFNRGGSFNSGYQRGGFGGFNRGNHRGGFNY